MTHQFGCAFSKRFYYVAECLTVKQTGKRHTTKEVGHFQVMLLHQAFETSRCGCRSKRDKSLFEVYLSFQESRLPLSQTVQVLERKAHATDVEIAGNASQRPHNRRMNGTMFVGVEMRRFDSGSYQTLNLRRKF